MKSATIKKSLAFIGLQWSLLAIVSAQTLPASEFRTVIDEASERLPKYEIEVIVFSYHDFDATEEKFEDMPRGSLLDLLSPSLLETHARTEMDVSKLLSESLRAIDDEQPILVPTEPTDKTYSIEDLFGSQQYHNMLGEEIFGFEETGPTTDSETYAPETRVDNPNLVPTEELNVNSLNNPESGFTEIPEDEAGNEVLLTEGESTWYRILTTEELELTNSTNRLERLSAYTPLIHGGWVQEGLYEEDAIPFELWLLGGLNPLGTIQLHMDSDKWLNISVALRYQSDRSPGELNSPVRIALEEITFPPRYALYTKRRISSNQVYFFDHPAFGLLVLVRPVSEESDIPRGSLAPAA